MEDLANVIYEILSTNTDKFKTEENISMALTKDNYIYIEIGTTNYKISIKKEN